MKRTKILALLLALVMIAGLFAACNGGETGTTTATEATTTEAATTTTEATTATTEAIATTTEATTTATTVATATETTEDPFAAFAGKEFTFSIKNCGGLYGDPA